MGQNKISGVYKITNKITGDLYIGSSKDIKHRWAAHRSPSRWKQYPNSKLYKDMAQYGKDKFILEVLEETTDLRNREQHWINKFKPSYNSIYAKGQDIERYKETHRRCKKEYYEIHRDELLAYKKAYCQAHRDEQLARNKDYYSRVCFYENETLTLAALSRRFRQQGIPHPCKEAKKYLIDGKRLMTEKS